MEKEFYELIRPILQSKAFRATIHHRHHIHSNVFEHSVKVAYLCYLHHKRYNLSIDRGEFVRAALLHDFYGYDWHDRTRGNRAHLFTHPRRALENARAHEGELTKTQRDMILHHMFPVVPLPPRSRAAWLLCYYDKLVTLEDYLGHGRFRAKNRYIERALRPRRVKRKKA